MNQQFKYFSRGKSHFSESDSIDENNQYKPIRDDFDHFEQDYDPSYKDEYEIRRNFYGVGPRGYKRSDLKLKEEAMSILQQDPILDSSDIYLEVSNNVLYLTGLVDSRRDKKRAEVLIEDIFGVEDVQNQLRITRR